VVVRADNLNTLTSTTFEAGQSINSGSILGKGKRLLRTSLFWGVTRCRLEVTDVLEQPVGPNFKNQTFQSDLELLDPGR
jgi:hypothetical protein